MEYVWRSARRRLNCRLGCAGSRWNRTYARRALCWTSVGNCSNKLLNRVVRRYLIRLEVQRPGPAGEMLEPCLFFQRLNAQRRTARHLPEGEFFKDHRRQSVLFLGRQLRKRGHGLPQQFSHSPILAHQFWSAHGSLPLPLQPSEPLFEAERKPAGLDVSQAAAIGVPYLAAWTSLERVGQIQAGETVLITGVSGAVGRAATQVAHWRKARVIGAGVSRDNPSAADAMIDTTTQDLALEVHTLTGGKGADLALDVVGGALFERVSKALREGGRQIAIASNPQVVSFNLVDFYHRRKQLIGVDTMSLSGEEIVATLNSLAVGFEGGDLTPPAVRTWPFAEAVTAYEAMAKGGPAVKHVLLME